MNKTSHTKNWTLPWPIAFLAIAGHAEASTLFDSHDILEVQIEAPLTTFMSERSDVDYLDGKFSYTDKAEETRSFDLKMRARGRYRRQKRTCNFPPIRLNFAKQQVQGSLLDGEDKLKLVTHCQNRRDKHEQYVLREYLAYRMLQILTDRSFRVRLMRITYVDTENDMEQMTKPGFVIEDDQSVAARLGLDVLETRSLTYEKLDARQTNLVNVFQYLIGNTDYSLVLGPSDDTCCHNSVPMTDGTEISPVPYDFDFAGLVDAPYADPNPKLKIRDVRTRLYRGRCDNNEHLLESISQVVDKKAAFYALIGELGDLDRQSRQSLTRYLNEFFAHVADEKSIQKNFVRECLAG